MYHIKITIGSESVTINEEKRALARAAVELSVAHPVALMVEVTRTVEPKEKTVSFAGLSKESVTSTAKPVAKSAKIRKGV